jgi:hypothetical protein
MPGKNMVNVQLGQETTWGTAVAATSLLRLLDEPGFEYSAEPLVFGGVGNIGVPNVVVPGQVSVEGNLKYYASYEDILYALVGLFGSVTPTGSNPYTWTFTAPWSSYPTPKTFTVEAGTTGIEYRVAGALWKALELSGESGAGVSVSIDLIAKTMQANAMTGSLTMRSVNPVTMNQVALYIDSWAGTMGTTIVPASLIDFTLNVETNRHLKYFTSANAEAWGDGVWEASLELTLEFNSTVKAYVDAILAGADQKQIQIKFTDGANREFTIQFAGVTDGGFSFYDDRDNNITVGLTYNAMYHSTLATWLKVIVKNAVQTLP